MHHVSGEPGPTREREFNRMMAAVIAFRPEDGEYPLLGVDGYGNLFIPTVRPTMQDAPWVLLLSFECIDTSTCLTQGVRVRFYEELQRRHEYIQSQYPTAELGLPA